ncbi:MAG: outer membrane lipoprotein chaperone LolA [Hydrogenophilaceae bacterium]|nr:outer membrane lipoprotein chaperone LolA [Hydrogenophilaceae bacterium]
MRKLIISLTLALLTLPAQAENRLQAFIAKTQAMSAQFSQVVYDRKGRKTHEATGSFQLQRPGKFRWAYQKPYEQLIVGDGKKVWIYDADLAQATVRPFDRAVGESPAALLAGNNEIEQFFQLKETGNQDGLDWVEATPKSQEGSFERVRLGFKGDELNTMELKDRFGQTTLLRFSKFQRNPTLSADLFRFTPPKGVDVIGNE